MDPYADALGFGGPAAPPAAPSDPYASALGFSTKTKAKKGVTPGPGVDVAGAPLLAQSPDTQARILADVQKTGAQNFTVNGMPPEATATPQPVAAPVAVAAPAAAPVASPAAPDVPWWQKVKAAGEAALATGTAATTGAIGGLAAGGNAAVKQVLYGATGTPLPPELQGPNAVNDAAARGAAALTYAPRTPLGQEYAGNVGQAVSDVAGPLTGLAPELAGISTLAKPAAAQVAGGRTMAAMKAGFEAKKAPDVAARVEPTAGPAPTTVPAGSGAAPTLANASPELQKAVAVAGPQANPSIVARHVEADTLPIPGRLTAGQAAQDPSLISQEMNGRGKGQAAPVPPEFYQQQGKTLAANMDAIRSTAAPDIPASASIVDHGQTLLDAYKTKDAAVTADISAKYKALADANGGSLPVNGQDFVNSADAALAKQMKGRYVPKEIAADLDTFREGGPMTFEDFENMRTNLAAEGRKAERAGDGNAAGAINIVRNSLESLPITGETAAIKPLADAARSAAKARFDAIKADPAYKAAVNDSTELGQPSPAADRFFNAYVRDGARENVARMQVNLGDNPAATQTIAAGVLDHLKGQLKADPVTGTFSQAGYNKALSTLGPKLGSLVDPTTAQQLQAVGGFAKNAQTQPRGSYVNNSNTAVELASQGAKTAAEHGTNMLFGGLPVGTVGRKVGSYVADTVGHRNAAKKSLEPGAGITRISDFPK